MMVYRLFVLGLVGVAAIAGCAGELKDPDRFPEVVSGNAAELSCEPVPALLTKSCAGGGCHSAADKVQGLDLESPGLPDRLAGVDATKGGKLVDPADPAKSVLYTKMTKTPPFGARMPYGGGSFDDAKLACIRTWLEQSGD